MVRTAVSGFFASAPSHAGPHSCTVLVMGARSQRVTGLGQPWHSSHLMLLIPVALIVLITAFWDGFCMLT